MTMVAIAVGKAQLELNGPPRKNWNDHHGDELRAYTAEMVHEAIVRDSVKKRCEAGFDTIATAARHQPHPDVLEQFLSYRLFTLTSEIPIHAAFVASV